MFDLKDEVLKPLFPHPKSLYFVIEKVFESFFQAFLNVFKLPIVILVIFQLVYLLENAVHHLQVFVLAEQKKLQFFQIYQIDVLLLVMLSHHLYEVLQHSARHRLVQEFVVLEGLIPQTVYQLPATTVRCLEGPFESSYPALEFRVLVLLADGEDSFEFFPGQIEVPLVALFDLFPGLKLLALGEEFLEFWALFGVKLGRIKNDGEETSNDLHSPLNEGLVLADGHFGFHECEDAVFWEGGEDVPSFFAGQYLSRTLATSKMS